MPLRFLIFLEILMFFSLSLVFNVVIMLQHRSVYLHCDVYLVGSLNLDTHVFKSLKFHNIRSFFFIAKTLGSVFYSLTNHFIAYCFVPLFLSYKKKCFLCVTTL